MAKFTLNKKFMPDIEQRVVRGLLNNAERGRDTAKPITPVLTGYAQKSVHAIVTNNGRQVAGETLDGNNNTVPAYEPRQMPTAIVGSNTAPRPFQFTGGGGYYLGLEMGVYSAKGSKMLATAYSEMQDEILDDIKMAMK
jgi:hypothetical protein